MAETRLLARRAYTAAQDLPSLARINRCLSARPALLRAFNSNESIANCQTCSQIKLANAQRCSLHGCLAWASCMAVLHGCLACMAVLKGCQNGGLKSGPEEQVPRAIQYHTLKNIMNSMKLVIPLHFIL